MIIAVDGPVAAGKGTLARRIAAHYGLAYLDTGALYRAVGLKLRREGLDPANSDAAVQAAQDVGEIALDDPALREEATGEAASIVAANTKVRAALLQYQRDFAKRPGGAVLDGRDIGTVVCPEAEAKLFLTASAEERARRQNRGVQKTKENKHRNRKHKDTPLIEDTSIEEPFIVPPPGLCIKT